MRTIFIIGTDISGVPESTIEPPILDNGLKFDRADPASMQNQYYEMAGIAGIQGIAVGLRGRRDPGYEHLPVFVRAIEEYTGPMFHDTAPTLMPFLDTGALRDIVNYENSGEPILFDFLNDGHLQRFWIDFVLPFYQAFPEGRQVPNPIRYERTRDGRPVILIWSIYEGLHTATNHYAAQRLLDYTTAQMEAAGYGTPAFIVDQAWLQASGLNVYGVHWWFSPWDHKAFSKTPHNGIITGVAVPGFNVKGWVIPRADGGTLRQALDAMRQDPPADYVFLESYNNAVENAGFYRSDAWTPRTLYLEIVREHIFATLRQEPPPPIPPPPESEDDDMDAVTKKPLLDWVLFPEGLVQTQFPNRFALRWNAERNEPDPNSNVVLSLDKNGTISTRELNQIAEWEASQPITAQSDKLVFVSKGYNNGKPEQAMLMFGLYRSV